MTKYTGMTSSELMSKEKMVNDPSSARTEFDKKIQICQRIINFEKMRQTIKKNEKKKTCHREFNRQRELWIDIGRITQRTFKKGKWKFLLQRRINTSRLTIKTANAILFC